MKCLFELFFLTMYFWLRKIIDVAISLFVMVCGRNM